MLYFTDMENLELETCKFYSAENTELATSTFNMVSVVQICNCLVVAGTQPSAQLLTHARPESYYWVPGTLTNNLINYN